MTTFTEFETPGGLTELSAQSRASWSEMHKEHAAQFAFTFPHYFDPTTPTAPQNAKAIPITWSAFPARLLSLAPRIRWQMADQDRNQQDEYCEWSVERDDDGGVRAVTFTTEVPEYWSHMSEHDPTLLLELYRSLVSPTVAEADLFAPDGSYMRDNLWNSASSQGIAHLRQGSNTLLAAIRLAAESTIIRHVDGKRVTDRQTLVVCGELGEPLRNSDPQIAEIVNDAVDDGLQVTLANPLGLYLDGLQSAGMVTPDGADAADFWTVERGTTETAVRARFEVPSTRRPSYRVADIFIGGVPIEFGAQVADKVRVRLTALAAPSDQKPQPQPCAGP